MHQQDPEMQLLGNELELTDNEDDAKAIREQIAAREELLKPIYLQAATEFADLHDKTGRMKAKGVIRSAVPWEESREFFYYRAKRRLAEEHYISLLRKADGSLSKAAAMETLSSMFSGDWEDDKAVASWFDKEKDSISSKVKSAQAAAMQGKIAALKAQLDSMEFM